MREVYIKARVSREDRDKINEASKKVGLTTSEYLRRLALGYKPRPPIAPDMLETIRLLKNLANNMNQIAHVANVFGEIDGESYHDLAVEVRNTVREIQRTVTGVGDN